MKEFNVSSRENFNQPRSGIKESRITEKSDSTVSKLLILATASVIVVLVLSIIYFFTPRYLDLDTILPEKDTEQTESISETEQQDQDSALESDSLAADEEEVIEVNTTFTYPREAAVEGYEFFEDLETIEGEKVYIASPLTIDTETPPPMIIYSHGSITYVTHDMNEPFMRDEMREYAKYFTDKGYMFAASNQHGQNWGNAASVEDTRLLVEYINTNYKTNGEIYMIGFSMGGLPTWNYMFQYPTGIQKAAMLAPTSYYSTYTQANFDAIAPIDVQIWHGTNDVNIGITMSRQMVARAAQLGKVIPLVELEGQTHWDVDTELMEEVWMFFEGE